MRGWQEELQWGVFMIVCLRCHPDDVKAVKTQRQITQTLQHADFSKQVQGSRVGVAYTENRRCSRFLDM